MSVAVAIVVPAHDEEREVGATVEGLCASIEVARRAGVVDEVSLEVVAHRCTDRTADRARTAMGARPYARVHHDQVSTSVGTVRDLGARRGLGRLGRPVDQTWVLSTDADTFVPPSWVLEVVEAAVLDDSTCVVGLSDLDQWHGDARSLRAYDDLLASKMRTGGEPGNEHGHVYGANLAVRGDAYLAVGGFPDVAIGEDQALVDALVAAGHRVTRTSSIRVMTSGRLRGRAVGGLADRLRGLVTATHHETLGGQA